MAGVTLEHVTRTFRTKQADVRAVDDLTLSVMDGELIVLLGPSGCGKTTTLRLIAGLEEPTAGTIRIGDRVVNRIAPKDRNVAMVFQDYALYPHLTVFQNMAFGLKMRRVPKTEIIRKVGEAADRLGLAHLLERKPSALSGGERQRVAVGRAIVRKPHVFLLDEPLSHLDAGLRTRMRTELKDLHRELRTTVVHVTHDQEEAMTLGDRLAVLREGVVQQCDTPLEVYNRPANRFVAAFVGTPLMNFFDGRLDCNGGEVSFIGRIGRVALPQSISSTLRLHGGRIVAMGVRPQHLWIKSPFSKEAGRPEVGHLTEGVVRHIEPLGDCTDVHLQTSGGESLVSRLLPMTSVSPGERVTIGLDVRHAHVFSTPDGRRLNESTKSEGPPPLFPGHPGPRFR